MIPYGDFLYFGILLYLAVPVVGAGVAGVSTRRLVLPTTLVMIGIHYGFSERGDWSGSMDAITKVIAFAIAQWLVAATFLRVRRRSKHQLAFYAAVALTLLPLAVAKLISADRNLVAFVGISYATFRALDVLFVAQDGLIESLPLPSYLSFLLFFPAISAGPIDRYRRFMQDYRGVRNRTEFLADLDEAVKRLFRGLLYGFVIAPLIDFYWLSPVSHRLGALAVVSYMYAYSLHLFFDFAGYSAFAIGVGYVLGVRMPENFNRPFLAQNIGDFWNRWHMTLSSWLRDHVYGRFVLSALKHKWFRDPYVAGYGGSFLAFGLMGLWHGPEARYLFYGFYHALLVIVHSMLHRPGRRLAVRLPPMAARVLTFHLVCLGFLVFSGRLF